MELTVSVRENKRVNDSKRIRRCGGIPAVLYSKGNKNENISISKEEFLRALSTLKPGDLSTTIFTLKSEKQTTKAIIKDIQYFVTNYEVSHIDFMRLEDKNVIQVGVPVRYIGEADCIGIKQGGTLRQIIRKVKVKCLPKDMPKEFTIDITNLEMGQAIRIKDLPLSDKVDTVIKNKAEVVAAITKR